jgi:hypothetical protein
VSWIRHRHPDALPLTRAKVVDPAQHRPGARSDERDPDARVFSGSHDGEARASAFAGPEDRTGRS